MIIIDDQVGLLLAADLLWLTPERLVTTTEWHYRLCAALNQQSARPGRFNKFINTADPADREAIRERVLRPDPGYLSVHDGRASLPLRTEIAGRFPRVSSLGTAALAAASHYSASILVGQHGVSEEWQSAADEIGVPVEYLQVRTVEKDQRTSQTEIVITVDAPEVALGVVRRPPRDRRRPHATQPVSLL